MNFWKQYQAKIVLGFKWLIFLLTLYYLYRVLFQSQDFDDFIEHLTNLGKPHFLLLGVTGILMIVNWGIEALKWQFLLQHIQKISFFKAYKAVFSGVTVSSLMPNRLAEYLGRIFYIQPQKRIKAVIATLVGSFAQTLTTILVGSIAFLFFFYFQIVQSDYLFYVVLALTVGLNILLIFLYFNIGLVNRLLPNRYKFSKVKQYVNVLSYFHSNGLGWILSWSIIRYIVFCTQYFLLLKIFNVEIGFLEGIVAIPLIFLVQAIIPTIALAELGIRGATAVHFISYYAGNTPGILTGAYSLWVINLLIPALIGACFLVFLKNTTSKE